MNEQIHNIASNVLYMVPIAVLLMAGWLKFQKSKMRVRMVDNQFIWKNSLFVGLLVFAVMFLGKPMTGVEENIIVGPADF